MSFVDIVTAAIWPVHIHTSLGKRAASVLSLQKSINVRVHRVRTFTAISVWLFGVMNALSKRVNLVESRSHGELTNDAAKIVFVQYIVRSVRKL